MRNLYSKKNNLKSDIVKKRYRLRFKGIVQGVGFRPFLYRSAKKFHLSGFVKNTSQGVFLEVEGKQVAEFIQYLLKNIPPLSKVEKYDVSEMTLENTSEFEILSSEEMDSNDLLVPPDIALCNNCKTELAKQSDRRYQYPFINCTDCGPRFTIIQGLPYDRPKTCMRFFLMCENCKKEYNDPIDRRYHAQPVSCFKCGPSFILNGKMEDTFNAPLEAACRKLKEGYVVAIKGLGGYHLACKASSDDCVLRLRRLKRRERKPFALMGTIEMIKKNCFVSEKEKSILRSPAAPILLLKKKKRSRISLHVAPGHNHIGFMLPYTPLHLMLLENMGEPLVMTSANFSDEPIIFKDGNRSLEVLSDFILSHNRKIHIFADDSVARIFNKKLYMIRRSRGYVPLPIDHSFDVSRTVLAIGPMLKTTFCFLLQNKALLSQYIGNTDSPASVEGERYAIKHFMKLFSINPDVLAIDKHPGYANRIIAADFKDLKVVEVQHHKAHVGSLLVEKDEKDKIIGISMDGTGYGDDGKIWGGEFFVGDSRKLIRFGHLKYLFLPSGDRSIKEPWRFALSVLVSLYGKSSYVQEFAERFGKKGKALLEVIEKEVHGVLTSSCGRLFDAVASICGIGDYNSYEGELPAMLQVSAESSSKNDQTYGFLINKGEESTILDLLPAIDDIINDKRGFAEKAFIFHKTLAQGILKMSELAREKFNINKVGLTGGVFQNTLLLKMSKNLLEENAFNVLIHSEIPPNDGGVSLGQALLASESV